jgi:glycine/D-amino acid oxidase-like deaminating enzyme
MDIMVRGSRMRLDENNSLWGRDHVPRNPPLKTDLKVDVAVIGAGYTGLSSAYHVKKVMPDKEVVVLEAEGAGHGASGRNGGMCLNQPSIDYMSMVHPESHKLTYDATAQSIREIVDLMKAQGFGPYIRIGGSLSANLDEKGVRKSKDYAAKAAALGLPIEFWDGDRVAQEIGTKVYAGGLFDPNAAEVEPMKLVLALKKAAEGLGVVVYENTPVRGISEGRPVRLHVGRSDAEDHTVSAAAVVLGTDGYSSKLGFFGNRLIATHTEMAATAKLREEVFSEIGWATRTPFHDDRIYLYHLGTTEDNRITIGAGNAEYFFNDSVTYKKSLDKRRKALKKELVRIYPSLKDVEFEYLWSGLMSFSLDMSQSVGVTGKNKNLYYGIGYAGHGVSLAFLFGKVIADMYAGRTDEWKRTPFYQNNLPSYLPPEPLRYVAVKTYMSYLRLLDFARG